MRPVCSQPPPFWFRDAALASARPGLPQVTGAARFGVIIGVLGTEPECSQDVNGGLGAAMARVRRQLPAMLSLCCAKLSWSGRAGGAGSFAEPGGRVHREASAAHVAA
jgi:hypothetical protein